MTSLQRLALALILILSAGLSVAQEKSRTFHDPAAQDFVHGAPSDPSDDWTLAAGGRIYDNWWEALDRKKPTVTHPSYPARGKASGPSTWRCKECHGWDYAGRDGEYATGTHYSGIPGIRAAQGRDLVSIMRSLRAPVHGYTPEMISDEELRRVAAFVSSGQHDVQALRDPKTGAPLGDVTRGRAVYQTTCAACHGFDGKLLNWGTAEEPAYIGTEANKFPWEVLHKIRNSHPGAAMINLRALPLSDSVAVLAYSRTLLTK